AGPEGFRKNQYRKFNIRSAELTPGDDFAMMREVLERRFRRLMAEAPREAESVQQTPSPSPPAGEGGEPPKRSEGGEPGEGAFEENPSPALASLRSLGHPLPQGERVTEQVASESDTESEELA